MQGEVWIRPARGGRAGQSGSAAHAGGERLLTGSATQQGRDWWMDRADECGTGDSVLPLSLPVPDPSGLVTRGAFSGPAAAQAELTGADEKYQLEAVLKI